MLIIIRLDDAASSIKTANIQPAGAALLDLTLTKLQYITFTHKKKTKKKKKKHSLLMSMHCAPNSVKCCQFMFLEFFKQRQNNPASQILKDLAFEVQFVRNWGV